MNPPAASVNVWAMLCRLALILASVVAVTVGIVALATTTRAVATPTVRDGDEGLKTLIYNARGRAVGYVTRTTPNNWNHDRAGELTVWKNRRTFWAALTHHICGGAIPVAAHRWRAWAGKRSPGLIVLRTSRRADLYGRANAKIGYTIGPDPVAAGTARLLLDRRECLEQ